MRRRMGDPEELLDRAIFRSDRRSHDARFQCLRSRQRREAWGNHHFLPFFSQCLSFSASISYNRLISINLVYRLACLVCSRCCVVYEWLIKFSWQMIFPGETVLIGFARLSSIHGFLSFGIHGSYQIQPPCVSGWVIEGATYGLG